MLLKHQQQHQRPRRQRARHAGQSTRCPGGGMRCPARAGQGLARGLGVTHSPLSKWLRPAAIKGRAEVLQQSAGESAAVCRRVCAHLNSCDAHRLPSRDTESQSFLLTSTVRMRLVRMLYLERNSVEPSQRHRPSRCLAIQRETRKFAVISSSAPALHTDLGLCTRILSEHFRH